jgi:hypothetical protein
MMLAQLAAVIMLQGGSAYNYETTLMRNRQKSTRLQSTVHATTRSQNLELSRSPPQLLMHKGSQRGGRAALEVSALGSASQARSQEEIETKLDSHGVESLLVRKTKTAQRFLAVLMTRKARMLKQRQRLKERRPKRFLPKRFLPKS